MSDPPFLQHSTIHVEYLIHPLTNNGYGHANVQSQTCLSFLLVFNYHSIAEEVAAAGSVAESDVIPK